MSSREIRIDVTARGRVKETAGLGHRREGLLRLRCNSRASCALTRIQQPGTKWLKPQSDTVIPLWLQLKHLFVAVDRFLHHFATKNRSHEGKGLLFGT